MINWHRYSRKLSATQFVILNLALGVGHFVVVLAAGAFLPMLPYIAGTLGESVPYAVWGQSNYVAAMALAFIIARPVMRRYGPRSMALAAYILFAGTGLTVIAFTHVYWLFATARTLQGLAAGLSIVPSLALLLEHYQKPKHRVATGLWGLAAFVPFSVGPALGGYFAYVLGDWRWMFMVFSALTLVVAGVIWAFVGDRPRSRDMSFPLHRLGLPFACLTGALLALQGVFNVSILTDMTSRAYASWWLMALCLLLAWLFWVCNSESEMPLIDFSLFRQRNYTFGLILLCVAFIGIQGAIVQYVLRLQFVEGYTAWHSGLLFVPLFLFSKPLSFRAHYLLHHGYDPRLLACVGLLGFAASFWWMGSYVRPATWETLLWPQLLEGAALGLFMASINAVILSNVPEAQQMHAVDVINMARTLAAAWIIALSDVIWDRCAAVARSNLSGPDVGNADAFLAGLAPESAMPGTPLYHQLHQYLVQQSGWMTFNTMFQVLAVSFLVMAGLIWLASATHISHRVNDQERVVETLGEDL